MVAGCSNSTVVARDDTGPGGDSGGGTDAGSGQDAGPGTDAGGNTGGSDAGARYPDGALRCAPGVECTNYAAALAAASRGAAGGTPDDALANCVVQMHRADCCGAMHASGINHGSRTTLCPTRGLQQRDHHDRHG